MSTPTRRSTAWVAGALLITLPAVVAVALLAANGNLEPVVGFGLPDPGATTRWALPVARALRDVGATLTIGSLVLAAVVVPGRPDAKAMLSPPQLHLLSAAVMAGSLWIWSGVAEIVLVYSDVVAQPVSATPLDQVSFFVTDIPLGRSLALSLAFAGVATMGSMVARTVTGVGLLAVVSLAALWPLSLTGHASGETNHDLGVNAQFLHLASASLWLGGLLALILLRNLPRTSFATVAARYSRIAGWCFIATATSGILSASLRLPSWQSLQSSYGLLVLLKIGALVLLGIAGWLHRRRLLPQLADTPPAGHAFVRLAIGELVIMGAAVGTGVALGRTPPPVSGPERPLSTAEGLLGNPLPAPLGGSEWFTEWRLDSFWAPFAIGALALYLVAVARLRSRGDRWSPGRTTAWVLGCLGLLWATSGAPGVYGDVLFSMHMVEHMTIATAVPVMLVLGAPVTLALRTLTRRQDDSRGAREWLLVAVHGWPLRLLGQPLVASGLFVTGLVAFYYSPLFELSMRTHTAHLLMTAHFLFTGYLFASVICGIDPGVRRPAYPLRVLLLMGTFAFHAFFTVSLMGSSTILAEDWFSALGRDWGNPLERDQYIGASLGWALGDYPLAILGGALIWSWVKDDHREARRLDRQADRDEDLALTTYNDQLRRLSNSRDFRSPRP
ncbi:cytochrome c oxidase assembly protein [Nocardioides sp.]|uniref:Copper resistance protein D family protein n=1 Tax=metagenome TaxID=256318 RepID=A0A2P2BX41_9ZZZZ